MVFLFSSYVVHFLSLAIYISLIWRKCITLATEQYLDYSSHPLQFKKTWPCIAQDNRKLNLVTHYHNVMTLFLRELLLTPTQTKAKETHFDCNGYRHNEIRLTKSCSIFSQPNISRLKTLPLLGGGNSDVILYLISLYCFIFPTWRLAFTTKGMAQLGNINSDYKYSGKVIS